MLKYLPLSPLNLSPLKEKHEILKVLQSVLQSTVKYIALAGFVCIVNAENRVRIFFAVYVKLFLHREWKNTLILITKTRGN